MPEKRGGWTTVAVWELNRILRRADFVLSVLLTPLLVVGVLSFTRSLEQRAENRVHRIAVSWRGGEARALRPVRTIAWLTPAAGEGSREALTQAVRARKYEAALVIPADFPVSGKADLIVRREAPTLRRTIEQALRREVRLLRAAPYGLDSTRLARLDSPVNLVIGYADPAAVSSRADRLVGLGTVLLLMTVIIITISYVSVGISGEKTQRVTEVVLSAIPAQAWIDGKIVAFTVIGLVNAVFWGVTAAWFLVAYVATTPTALQPGNLALSVLFAVLGLAFYVAMFAALMATLKDFQSASKLQGNLFVVPFLPILVMNPVLDQPESLLSVVVSLLPPFAPMLMPMRMALGHTPPWQILAALVLLAAGVWFMRRLAGIAFRVGMLMYGKDLNLPELIRLARQR